MTDSTAGSPEVADNSTTPAFTRGEWIALLLWPWWLALALVLSYSGEITSLGTPLARVACTAVVGSMLAAMIADSHVGAGTDLANRARQTGRMAAVLGGLSLPVLAGVVVSTPMGAGIVPLLGVFLSVTAYSMMQTASVVGPLFPAVAGVWLALPPFAFYLLIEMLSVRADAILMVSPASAIVAAATSANPMLGCIFACVVPVVAGAALSVVPGMSRAAP